MKKRMWIENEFHHLEGQDLYNYIIAELDITLQEVEQVQADEVEGFIDGDRLDYLMEAVDILNDIVHNQDDRSALQDFCNHTYEEFGFVYGEC